MGDGSKAARCFPCNWDRYRPSVLQGSEETDCQNLSGNSVTEFLIEKLDPKNAGSEGGIGAVSGAMPGVLLVLFKVY